MRPVDDMRWCRWCQATKPVDHDCVGDAQIPCEDRREGRPCGICGPCLAAQVADLTERGDEIHRNGEPT